MLSNLTRLSHSKNHFPVNLPKSLPCSHWRKYKRCHVVHRLLEENAWNRKKPTQALKTTTGRNLPQQRLKPICPAQLRRQPMQPGTAYQKTPAPNAAIRCDVKAPVGFAQHAASANAANRPEIPPSAISKSAVRRGKLAPAFAMGQWRIRKYWW